MEESISSGQNNGKDFASDYELGGPLGEGSFGTVHLCFHKESGVPCAVKIVDKVDDMDGLSRLPMLLQGEVNTLRVLLGQRRQHSGIARVLDLYHDACSHYFVIELMAEGTLLDHVNRIKHLARDSSEFDHKSHEQ